MRICKFHRSQQGVILLAMVVLLMVVAAAVMVNRANRISNSGAADVTARLQLIDWLTELKYALVIQAINEDNTPGTLRCPKDADGKTQPTCGPTNISGGTPTLDGPGISKGPDHICVQYVLAPSLRNSLNTSARGTDPAQKSINPTFDPDLFFTDRSGTTTKVWAVVLAGQSGGGCALSDLGFQITYSTDGKKTAALTVLNEKSAQTNAMPFVKKDFMTGLFTQVLASIDQTTFQLYLKTHASTSEQLTTVRLRDPFGFDTALAPTGDALDPSDTSNACRATVVSSGASSSSISSSSSTSASSSSPAVTYKKPVSWLCFNAWYDYITFDPATSKYKVSDSTTGLTCTRQGGTTSCTN